VRRASVWIPAGVLVGSMLAGTVTLPTTVAAAGATTLPARVTSVRGTLLPYNPMTQTGGTPAEKVVFRVGGRPIGPFVCTVEVFRSNALVGNASVTGTGPSVHRWLREIARVFVGRTFRGIPSDASVACQPW
jgi:hypothetical protein